MRARIRALGKPGDLGWVVMAHGECYAREFGWDNSFEALVTRIVADYADSRDNRAAAWIAELDGRRAGCVFCVPVSDDTAQLRILLVDPAARGHGIGGLLVDQCLNFASASGFQWIKLWTNHPLTAARRIYLSRGFRLVEENEHHSFGMDLRGQVYIRAVTASHTPSPAARPAVSQIRLNPLQPNTMPGVRVSAPAAIDLANRHVRGQRRTVEGDDE